MRHLVLSFAFALVAASSVSHAQQYPAKVVRAIVPSAPGGSIDVVGRLLAQRFSESMGQQFIIETRAGAAGTIGTAAVAKAPPDGYTLLVASQSGLSSAPSLIAKLPYDPLRDLTPIIFVANQPSVLVVHPSLPVRTTKDFIALAKAKPGKFTFGSSGIGATQHLSAELFGMMTGTRLTHIPYKGGALAMTELLSGQIEFMFSPAPTATPYLKANRMRAIAITSMRRIKSLPNVPTLHESGVPGYDFSGWIGLLGPANMSRELVMKLHGETVKALADEALNRQLVDLGFDMPGGTPEQFARFIKEDIAKTAKIVAAAKIQPE